MVGRIMIPSRIEAVKILFPFPLKCSLINGTNTTRPKNPYTIEGMPAKRSTIGFKMRYSFSGQKRAIKIDISIPTGTPIKSAPPVT